MKKILKSKIFWAVIIILIASGAFAARYFSQPKKVEYVTEDVKRGSIIQTVTATGKVKSATDIQLNFKNAGQLSVLSVKTGDQVTSGQILAQLKASDLSINVAKAEANVAQMIATLNKLKAGATKQDIQVSRAAVDTAKTALANAQSDLDNTKTTYTQNVANALQTATTDIGDALTKANISLQRIYDTINYKGNPNNLSTANVQLYQKVVTENGTTISTVDSAELSYNVAKLDNSNSNVDDAINKTKTALSQISATLDDTASMLGYVIVTNTLSQTDLDTLKTTINTERVTTAASISTIEGAAQSLTTARQNLQTKVDDSTNAVTAAEKSLAAAQANLDLKLAPARAEDIASAQANVLAAQADLQYAQEKYDETIIHAPIDGVITDTNFSVGEQTNLTTPVITMLANKKYEIEVDIPESDIVKVAVGNSVDITLDAFTDQDIFKGAVTSIDPAQTEIQDVIYYKVTVAFEDVQPDAVKPLVDKIKPGMTANITANTARIDDALSIPLRAVHDVNGKKTVDILTPNGDKQTVEVQLGLKGDEGMVQVTSGLSAGQKVITFTRTN